jgi:hypothetical protein
VGREEGYRPYLHEEYRFVQEIQRQEAEEGHFEEMQWKQLRA